MKKKIYLVCTIVTEKIKTKTEKKIVKSQYVAATASARSRRVC
jgi:hypothetical protein